MTVPIPGTVPALFVCNGVEIANAHLSFIPRIGERQEFVLPEGMRVFRVGDVIHHADAQGLVSVLIELVETPLT